MSCWRCGWPTGASFPDSDYAKRIDDEVFFAAQTESQTAGVGLCSLSEIAAIDGPVASPLRTEGPLARLQAMPLQVLVQFQRTLRV